MINIKCTREQTEIEVDGSLLEILAELGLSIGHIYEQLRRQKPEAGRDFREAMQAAMSDDSPIWTPVRSGGSVVVETIDMDELLRQMKEERDGRP